MNIYKAKAVANLIAEIDICLCCFTWVPSQVPRFWVPGCRGFAFSHRGISYIMNIYKAKAVANLIAEIDICLCRFTWVPSQVPRFWVPRVPRFCIFSQGNHEYLQGQGSR